MTRITEHKQRFLNKCKAILPYIFILLFVAALVGVQICQHVFIAGADANFHMNQYYDAAMQIKTGHWNYFLSFFGFNHFGRIVNAVYGPFFMYLNGQLLLWAKTWMNFEIAQDFIYLSLSGIFFYILARKNYLKVIPSIIFGCLYILSQPVMAWMLQQEFSGIGAILFPLVLIQATQMVRTKKIHPLALGITIAITAQTHILTTLLSCIILVPFFVYAFIENKGYRAKLHLCMYLIYSMIITLLLTANVWCALLNILPQSLIPTIPQGMPTFEGAIKFTKNASNPSFVLNRADIIILLITIVCGIVGILFWKASNVLFKMTYISGLIFLYLSTVYAPWRFIFHHMPQLEYQFQYPKRFLGIGVSLLLLSTIMILNNHDVQITSSKYTFNAIIHGIIYIGFIFCIIFNFENQVHYINNATKVFKSNDVVSYAFFHTDVLTPKQNKELRQSYFKPNLAKPLHMAYQDTGDYLPTNEKPITTYDQYRSDGIFSGLEKQLQTPQEQGYYYPQINTNRMNLYWYSHHSGSQLIPVVKYKDTSIKLDGKEMHHVFISRVGAINLNVPRGYNKLTVSYHTPHYLHTMIIVSILSWLAVLLYGLWKMLSHSSYCIKLLKEIFQAIKIN